MCLFLVCFNLLFLFVVVFLYREYRRLDGLGSSDGGASASSVPGARRSRRRAAKLMRKRGTSAMVLEERIVPDTRAFWRKFYDSPVSRRGKRKYWTVFR